MTGALLGLVAGCGALLVLLALTGPRRAAGVGHREWNAAVLASALPCGLLAGAVALVATGVPAIALLAALVGGAVPVTARRRRQEARRRAVQQAWPDAVDTLASGVRAGLSLPEAVASVGESGPAALRPAFTAFAVEHRLSGSFAAALAALRASSELPRGDRVADRVTAALELAAEVGGADLGAVLRALSQMLRDDSRVRTEIEARQSWTVAAARLAVAAPFATAILLSLRPEAARAYASPGGGLVLGCAALLSAVAYLLMRRVARLPA